MTKDEMEALVEKHNAAKDVTQENRPVGVMRIVLCKDKVRRFALFDLNATTMIKMWDYNPTQEQLAAAFYNT